MDLENGIDKLVVLQLTLVEKLRTPLERQQMEYFFEILHRRTLWEASHKHFLLLLDPSTNFEATNLAMAMYHGRYMYSFGY